MRDLTSRQGIGRTRFKLRASHRSLSFGVSHHRPPPVALGGIVPDKDRDLDDLPHAGHGKRKK